MSASTSLKASTTSQSMGLEAIFLHNQESGKKTEDDCADQGYWGGCMAVEEAAGHRVTSSLNYAAQLIQAHHGLSSGRQL